MRQSELTTWFSSVQALTDADLADLDASFVTRNREFMAEHSRGFGYWVWRPFLLRALASRLPADHVLVFLDAGCELNETAGAAARLAQYVDMASEHGFLAMRTGYSLARWAKADLIQATDSADRQHYAGLIEPGVMLMSGGSLTMERMSLWGEWCEKDEHHFLDDSPSKLPNDPNFVEHRHDQSILTALDQTLDLHTIPRETYFGGSWHTAGHDFPFWATRNRWPIRRESGNVLERAASSAHVRLSGKGTGPTEDL